MLRHRVICTLQCVLIAVVKPELVGRYALFASWHFLLRAFLAAPNIVLIFFSGSSDIYKAKTGLTQNIMIMTLMSALSYKFNNILHNTIQEGKKIF